MEIEIVIEIDFWYLSDFDGDFDVDECWPLRGFTLAPAISHSEIMKIHLRTKMLWFQAAPGLFRASSRLDLFLFLVDDVFFVFA